MHCPEGSGLEDTSRADPDPHGDSRLSFDKDTEEVSGERTVFSTSGAGNTRHHLQPKQISGWPQLTQNLNQSDSRLTCRTRHNFYTFWSVRLSKDSTGGKPHELEWGRSESQSVVCKLSNCCGLGETVADCVSDNGFVSRVPESYRGIKNKTKIPKDAQDASGCPEDPS